ncbi:MAG TPA: response regulator transcription factor [Verrucomicrobiae bacterium]|nr:response regulator transcription factor [Verrucomicrobiae bacterium]
MAKKLMIVDERAVSRHLVRQASATPHDTVLECATPEEAMKAIGVFQPDCVMMGVSLPAPGAFKAIRKIRKAYPEMRVLAVSSLPEPELRHAANEAGAAGYVTTENLSELFLLAAPERLACKPVRPAATVPPAKGKSAK